MVYVPNNKEMEWLIVREFHVKPYSSHSGYHKTLTTIIKSYYWKILKNELVDFMVRYIGYHQVKVECRHLEILLQPIPIPEWKWDLISMDFIIGLPKTSIQNVEIMWVVDKLKNVAHFVEVKSTNSTSDLAQILIK